MRVNLKQGKGGMCWLKGGEHADGEVRQERKLQGEKDGAGTEGENMMWRGKFAWLKQV